MGVEGVFERFGTPNCVSQFRAVERVQLGRIDKGYGGFDGQACALDDTAKAFDGVLVSARVIAQLRLYDDRPSAGLLDQDIRPPAALEHVACPFGPHGPTAAEAVEDLSQSDVYGLLMCRIQHRAILTGHRERLGCDCQPTAPG